jgi:hypothetical protein
MESWSWARSVIIGSRHHRYEAYRTEVIDSYLLIVCGFVIGNLSARPESTIDASEMSLIWVIHNASVE